MTGPQPEDAAYAAAIRHAAKRWQTDCCEKAWRYSHDARRTAQG